MPLTRNLSPAFVWYDQQPPPLSGRTDVTEATRRAERSMDRPFTILGLTL
jgi:hypothetical protein